MTAHAELRGFPKGTALLLLVFGGLGAILYLMGWNRLSFRIRFAFWFTVAVTFGAILLAFIWRVFWRLHVEDGTLTWRLLTRRYDLPLATIRAIDAQVMTIGRSASHVVVVRGAGDHTMRFEVATWNEDELRAVLREVRARSNPSVSPAVEGWLG